MHSTAVLPLIWPWGAGDCWFSGCLSLTCSLCCLALQHHGQGKSTLHTPLSSPSIQNHRLHKTRSMGSIYGQHNYTYLLVLSIVHIAVQYSLHTRYLLLSTTGPWTAPVFKHSPLPVLTSAPWIETYSRMGSSGYFLKYKDEITLLYSKSFPISDLAVGSIESVSHITGKKPASVGQAQEALQQPLWLIQLEDFGESNCPAEGWLPVPHITVQFLSHILFSLQCALIHSLSRISNRWVGVDEVCNCFFLPQSLRGKGGEILPFIPFFIITIHVMA